MCDPKDIIKDWINEELERQGREGTPEEYAGVVEELPEFVDRGDIKRIVEKVLGR